MFGSIGIYNNGISDGVESYALFLRLSLFVMSCKPNTEGEKQGRAANGYAQQISSLPVSTHEDQFTY